MFEIRLGESIPERRAIGATILIGSFREGLEIPIGTWNLADYFNQWKVAVERLTEFKISAFITSFSVDDKGDYGVIWWPMYLVEDQVQVQNQILMNEINPDFDVASWWDFVDSRATTSDDGDKLSEWTTSVDDIGEFTMSLDAAD